MTVDWSALEAGLGTLLVEELAPVVRGAAEDLRAYGFSIAGELSRALMAGDKLAADQLRAQVKLLIEIQRIRVEVVDWDLTEKIVLLVFKATAAAVGAAIPRP